MQSTDTAVRVHFTRAEKLAGLIERAAGYGFDDAILIDRDSRKLDIRPHRHVAQQEGELGAHQVQRHAPIL